MGSKLPGRPIKDGEKGPPNGGESERRRGIRGVCEVRAQSIIASAPCLFFHGIHLGKCAASNWATGSEVSTARWRGVSQLALREMPSFSWPASMRNSAMSSRPSWAARWRDVLPLSVKSGFWRLWGLFLIMRLRRLRSLRWMARRMRMETLILEGEWVGWWVGCCGGLTCWWWYGSVVRLMYRFRYIARATSRSSRYRDTISDE